MTLPPAGWYPDPNDPLRQRYWNGEMWTEHFAPPVQTGPPEPPGYFIPAAGVPSARFESVRGLANATVVLLAVTALLAIASAFVSLDRATVASDFLDDPASVSLSEVQDADDRVQLTGVLAVASYIVTGIVFVIWFQRCYKNSQALGASHLRFSSGWAAGAWFVPFLNLVRPKQIADDIWKSTDPAAPAQQGSSWMANSVPPLINAWWGFFIGGAVVGRIVATLSRNSDSLSELRTLDRVAAGAQIITVVAAILAVLVVRAMTTRGEQRAATLGVAA